MSRDTELALFALLVCLKIGFALWIEFLCWRDRDEIAAHKAAVDEFLLEWDPFTEECTRFGWFRKKRA